MDLSLNSEGTSERPKPGLPHTHEGVSRRRVAIAVVLVAAVVFAVYAFHRAPSSSVSAPASDPAVQQYLPAKPGAHVLTQSEVGVILKPGYDGRISINGVRIPEDQMDGVIPPSSPTYNPSLGFRPNNKNFVAFTPGPDKVFTKLPSGAITVSVTFWLVAKPSAKHTIAWQLSTV